MWLIWILIIVVLVFVLRAVFGAGNPVEGAPRETPLEILKKRFARGEIDEEEYERRRKELER